MKQPPDGRVFIAQQQVESLERCILGMKGKLGPMEHEGSGLWKETEKGEWKMMLIRFV